MVGKILTIIKNGVDIINRNANTTTKSNDDGLEGKIQQMKREFELILKRAEGCQQVIKFVAETVS